MPDCNFCQRALDLEVWCAKHSDSFSDSKSGGIEALKNGSLLRTFFEVAVFSESLEFDQVPWELFGEIDRTSPLNSRDEVLGPRDKGRKQNIVYFFVLEWKQVAHGDFESPQEEFPITYDIVCLQFPRVIEGQEVLS